MKHLNIVLFVSIAISIYSAVNIYVIKRMAQGLVGLESIKTLIIGLLILCAITFPAGEFADRMLHNTFSRIVAITGAWYLGVLCYLFLGVLLIDMLRFVNWCFSVYTFANPEQAIKILRIIMVAGLLGMIAILAVGRYNAVALKVRSIELSINGRSATLDSLHVVMVSDIHLGSLIGVSQFSAILEKVKGLNPDLVLIVGDLFDQDISATMEQDISTMLRSLKAPLGVFAVTGNHEYYSGLEKAVASLAAGGVCLLQDSSVLVGNSVYLIGRKDRTAERLTNGRKSLEELVKDLPDTLPRILMDHQPLNLEMTQKNNIDLQLSGHTHNGQLFPFNFITRRIYELSYGYLKKGSSHFVVSCGAGTWGPPIRTSSRSEVVDIKINFTDRVGK